MCVCVCTRVHVCVYVPWISLVPTLFTIDFYTCLYHIRWPPHMLPFSLYASYLSFFRILLMQPARIFSIFPFLLTHTLFLFFFSLKFDLFHALCITKPPQNISFTVVTHFCFQSIFCHQPFLNHLTCLFCYTHLSAPFNIFLCFLWHNSHFHITRNTAVFLLVTIYSLLQATQHPLSFYKHLSYNTIHFMIYGKYSIKHCR